MILEPWNEFQITSMSSLGDAALPETASGAGCWPWLSRPPSSIAGPAPTSAASLAVYLEVCNLAARWSWKSWEVPVAEGFMEGVYSRELARSRSSLLQRCMFDF